MCQYSSENGFANEWHHVHLGQFALGGAGLVFTEATAVSPEGRITTHCLGIYSDDHAEKLAPIVKFIHSHGAKAGIQLAHAGRKASTYRPWSTQQGSLSEKDGAWTPLAPSTIPFSESYPMPKEMTAKQLAEVKDQWVQAAIRAVKAGFDVIEIHAAHGYLFHEFLSPLSNHRSDEYGGNLENRFRFLRETVTAIRSAIPVEMPLFVRISSTDWTENGWDIEQSIQACKWLKELGVDLIDCSSGGNIAGAKIPIGPGYQVPFAEEIRLKAKIATGAVGLITTPEQADTIVRTDQADLVFLARAMLRNPYWALQAASELKVKVDMAPVQYIRAW